MADRRRRRPKQTEEMLSEGESQQPDNFSLSQSVHDSEEELSDFYESADDNDSEDDTTHKQRSRRSSGSERDVDEKRVDDGGDIPAKLAEENVLRIKSRSVTDDLAELNIQESDDDGETRHSSDGERRNEDGGDKSATKQDEESPSFIPTKGNFYQHDRRANDDSDRALSRPMRSQRADTRRWVHDKFDEFEQTPKSREELIEEYGYDIRARAYNDPPPSRSNFRNKRGTGVRPPPRGGTRPRFSERRPNNQRPSEAERDDGTYNTAPPQAKRNPSSFRQNRNDLQEEDDDEEERRYRSGYVLSQKPKGRRSKTQEQSQGDNCDDTEQAPSSQVKQGAEKLHKGNGDVVNGVVRDINRRSNRLQRYELETDYHVVENKVPSPPQPPSPDPPPTADLLHKRRGTQPTTPSQGARDVDPRQGRAFNAYYRDQYRDKVKRQQLQRISKDQNKEKIDSKSNLEKKNVTPASHEQQQQPRRYSSLRQRPAMDLPSQPNFPQPSIPPQWKKQQQQPSPPPMSVPTAQQSYSDDRHLTAISASPADEFSSTSPPTSRVTSRYVNDAVTSSQSASPPDIALLPSAADRSMGNQHIFSKNAADANEMKLAQNLLFRGNTASTGITQSQWDAAVVAYEQQVIISQGLLAQAQAAHAQQQLQQASNIPHHHQSILQQSTSMEQVLQQQQQQQQAAGLMLGAARDELASRHRVASPRDNLPNMGAAQQSFNQDLGAMSSHNFSHALQPNFNPASFLHRNFMAERNLIQPSVAQASTVQQQQHVAFPPPPELLGQQFGGVTYYPSPGQSIGAPAAMLVPPGGTTASPLHSMIRPNFE